MKQNITVENFISEHKKLRPDNFTREGLIALFNFYEEIEQDIELDVIRDCVYFSEYKNLKEFHNDYDKTEYPDVEQIEERTTLIKISKTCPRDRKYPKCKGFIIENF